LPPIPTAELKRGSADGLGADALKDFYSHPPRVSAAIQAQLGIGSGGHIDSMSASAPDSAAVFSAQSIELLLPTQPVLIDHSLRRTANGGYTAVATSARLNAVAVPPTAAQVLELQRQEEAKVAGGTSPVAARDDGDHHTEVRAEVAPWAVDAVVVAFANAVFADWTTTHAGPSAHKAGEPGPAPKRLRLAGQNVTLEAIEAEGEPFRIACAPPRLEGANSYGSGGDGTAAMKAAKPWRQKVGTPSVDPNASLFSLRIEFSQGGALRGVGTYHFTEWAA
jgi:hypothetical protein